ncbi:MAG: hypothetical protein Q7S33_02980, partial [Nanoarchaeota archaeon]|nr:hypothetical protein [Nanoarchaeota archaeon]
MVDNKYSSVMLLVLSVFFIFSLTIVSALPLASVDQTNTPSLIERINSNNLFNLTINSTSENITRVDIYVTGLGGDIGNLVESFVVGTNRTDAGNVVIFRNSTVGGVTSLSWENATANGGLIPNNTNYTFTFNLTGRSLTMQGLSNITINITGISGNKAQISSFVKGYSFSFSGNVKNTTTDCQNNTNVSLYLFAMGTNGPPTETYVKSVLTSGSDGCLFSMTGINTTGSSQMYKLKLIKYANLSNSSFNCASLSSNCVATSVGPTMQDFPTMMYYSMPTPPGMLEWMMPPTLNGTTFTLQSAVTINVSTYSNTTTSMHNFGYELMDINSGFPITSAMNDNQTSYQIVVPAGRDYNLMVARQPNKFSMATNECNGIHYNSTHCPAPPKTNASLGTLTATQGSVIQARLNITVEKRYLYGCLGISGNTSAVANISAIVAKMIPYTGFVPPVKGDDGSLNISNPLQVNTSFTNCSGGGMFAFYNISLMNTNYMIAFYATNKSNISTSGETYAQFYNVSLTDSQTITNGNYTNLTLKLLLGTWTNEDSDGVNVTKMKINILNASGNIYSSFTGHIEVVTKRPTNGKVRYMIESRNATFFIPIISDTTLATVNVFSNGPPVEKKLNLSLNENNITVSDGQGFGFKKKLTNGSFEDMNVSATPIRMRLITNSVACNIINYADSCVISNMSAESFNPFKAMTAGKVNLEMKMTNTNTTITFMNFDMFAAKPPTNSMFDESGTTSGSTNQVWKFGS